MKRFVDPKGLFVINVPNRFFAIRRTVKGDLPDEATGKGRRGSSIFTAGDMSKAEVVAIERYVGPYMRILIFMFHPFFIWFFIIYVQLQNLYLASLHKKDFQPKFY